MGEMADLAGRLGWIKAQMNNAKNEMEKWGERGL